MLPKNAAQQSCCSPAVTRTDAAAGIYATFSRAHLAEADSHAAMNVVAATVIVYRTL